MNMIDMDRRHLKKLMKKVLTEMYGGVKNARTQYSKSVKRLRERKQDASPLRFQFNLVQ